ncbi:hypothetical protein ACFXPN_06690 [Streptomyces griseorubiginosus]
MRSPLPAIRAGHVFDGVHVKGAGTVLVEDGVIRDVDFTEVRHRRNTWQ